MSAEKVDIRYENDEQFLLESGIDPASIENEAAVEVSFDDEGRYSSEVAIVEKETIPETDIDLHPEKVHARVTAPGELVPLDVEDGEEPEIPDEIVAVLAANNVEYRRHLARRRASEKWTEKLMDMDSYTAKETDSNLKGMRGISRRMVHAVKNPLETSQKMVHNIRKGGFIRRESDEVYDSMNAQTDTEISRLQETLEGIKYGEDAMDVEAGEKVKTFALVGGELADNPETEALQIQAQQIFEAVANGTIDANAAETAIQPILAEIAESDPNLSIDIAVNASNLVEVFNAYKAAAEHMGDSHVAMEKVKLSLGEVQTGLRTEADLNRLEEALNGSGLLTFAQGRAVNTGLSVGAAAAGVAAAPVGIGVAAATAGVMGAVNQGTRSKMARESLIRDVATGIELDEDDKYTSRMLETVYKMHNADALNNDINTLFYDTEGNLKELDGAELDYALAFLADAQMRIELSATEKVDLLSYTDGESVEKQRRALMLTLAKVNREMRDATDMYDADHLDTQMGLANSAIASMLKQDMAEKDSEFKKQLRKDRIVAGASRAAIAGTIGGTAAVITELGDVDMFKSEHTEVIKGTKTVERDIEDYVDSYWAPIPGKDGAQLELPNNVEAFFEVDGRVQLEDNEGNVIISDGISHSDGKIHVSNEAMSTLEEKGLRLDADRSVITSAPKVETEVVEETVERTREASETVTTSSPEWMKEQIENGEAKAVRSQQWLNNGTEASDGNELRFHWGGENNSGITADGQFQFDVSTLSGESFRGDTSFDVGQEMANGNVVVTASASPEDGGVIVMEVPADGIITVDPESPMGQLFTNENGQIDFNGFRLQTQIITGEGADGADFESINTWVGDGDAETFTYEKTFTETYDEVLRHTETHTIPGLKNISYDYKLSWENIDPTIVEETEELRTTSELHGFGVDVGAVPWTYRRKKVEASDASTGPTPPAGESSSGASEEDEPDEEATSFFGSIGAAPDPSETSDDLGVLGSAESETEDEEPVEEEPETPEEKAERLRLEEEKKNNTPTSESISEFIEHLDDEQTKFIKSFSSPEELLAYVESRVKEANDMVEFDDAKSEWKEKKAFRHIGTSEIPIDSNNGFGDSLKNVNGTRMDVVDRTRERNGKTVYRTTQATENVLKEVFKAVKGSTA